MTAKKFIAVGALVIGATLATATASFAQYYGAPYSYYDYAGPGGYYGGGPYSPPNWMRGGPGPRVLDGSGMGIGAVR
jgi:hypothetical protein